MKNVVIFMLLVAMMIAISGCQTAKSFCEDVSGSAAWCAEKLESSCDKAADRDAAIAAKRLQRRAIIMEAIENYAKRSGAAHTKTVRNNEVQ